jgi:hypothetical protein
MTHFAQARTYVERRAKLETAGSGLIDRESAELVSFDREFPTFIARPRPIFIAQGVVSGGASPASAEGLGAGEDPSDPVSEASSKRLQLLARKFAGDASREDVARIEILTSRLEALAPRTTHEDIAKLEQQVATIESIANDLHAARQKFGKK